MDFWQVHGLVFLIAVTLFPRITMLVIGVVSSFGLLGWIGFFFAPHLTVAILATTRYWDTNPVLCVIAWLVALREISSEVRTASKVVRR